MSGLVSEAEDLLQIKLPISIQPKKKAGLVLVNLTCKIHLYGTATSSAKLLQLRFAAQGQHMRKCNCTLTFGTGPQKDHET